MGTLAEAHSEIRALLAILEVETAKAVPDMATLSSTRMKLTQASRRRAMLIEALLPRCRETSSAILKAEYDRLAADIQAARFASAAHIGRWTLRAVEADWNGYCLASVEMRAQMRRQIEREIRLLQPVLNSSPG